jgi:hypothetical protein
MNFLSYFKGPSSHYQQKTNRRRLITSKVNLTGQSHLMLIFVLRKVTLPNRINSVPRMNGVTPTPYHECTQLAKTILFQGSLLITPIDKVFPIPGSQPHKILQDKGQRP